MKKYFAPTLEMIACLGVDVLTASAENTIERPNIENPNEVPGVPLD